MYLMNLSITDSGKLGEKVVISITVSSLAIDSTKFGKQNGAIFNITSTTSK